MYLLVGNAESEMNVVEALFIEVLNMSITIEAPMKGCLRFLDLASVSGSVCVHWKYELSEKKMPPVPVELDISLPYTMLVTIYDKILALAQSCDQATLVSFESSAGHFPASQKENYLY